MTECMIAAFIDTTRYYGVQGTDIKAGARLTGVMLKVKYVAQFVGESAGSGAGGATSILHNSH